MTFCSLLSPQRLELRDHCAKESHQGGVTQGRTSTEQQTAEVSCSKWILDFICDLYSKSCVLSAPLCFLSGKPKPLAQPLSWQQTMQSTPLFPFRQRIQHNSFDELQIFLCLAEPMLRGCSLWNPGVEFSQVFLSYTWGVSCTPMMEPGMSRSSRLSGMNPFQKTLAAGKWPNSLGLPSEIPCHAQSQ